MSKKIPKWNFRDVSSGIAKLREMLLGRKYIYHNRFPPLISPRTIPPPDIPRGPEYKYSNQWYGNRNALGSVKPPVVAPIAEGAAGDTKKSSTCAKPVEIDFPCPPTPGMPWWFDGHCYYIQFPDPCTPPPTPPPPCPKNVQAEPPCPPICREEKPSTSSGPAAQDPCDPCRPPVKKQC